VSIQINATSLPSTVIRPRRRTAKSIKVGRGEAAEFIRSGATRPGGVLPMNTNGGGLLYAHTGMYGMFALQEAVRQLQGRASAQVAEARINLVLGAGGMFTAAGAVALRAG
jgi:hypothetical protein